MLQHYSTRMIQDIYLLPDGRTIELNFFNAFWVPKQGERLRITNLGYFQPSRMYNLDVATYMQDRKIYINMPRNMYKNTEYNEMIRRMMTGQEITFASYNKSESVEG